MKPGIGIGIGGERYWVRLCLPSGRSQTGGFPMVVEKGGSGR